MAQSRISFTLEEKVSISLAALLALFAGVVTFIFDRSGASNILIFPLLPGLIAHLLITGAHGGTTAQETIAPWIASVVNGGFYFGIVIVGRLIWRKLASRPTAYKRIS